MIPLHRKIRSGFSGTDFFALFGLFGERVAHERAFAVAGGDDGVACGVFAGIENGVAALLADVSLRAVGLDLPELLVRMRLPPQGLMVSIKTSYSCIRSLLSASSVPQTGPKMQIGRFHDLGGPDN